MPQRKDVLSKEMNTLASANATLLADKARLERENESLRTSSRLLEQRNTSLKVMLVVLLAATAGLTVGMATSMEAIGPQAALGSATGVFFAVIMTSVAILSYVRR